MKNIFKVWYLVGALSLVAVFGVIFNKDDSNFGAETVNAQDQNEAVGIIVKNGAKIDQVLANTFTMVNEQCDPGQISTTTQPAMCDRPYYQGRKVKVFYSIPRAFSASEGQFAVKTSGFSFDGGIDYVNRSDKEADAALIKYMNEQCCSITTLIYEP